MTRTCFIHIGLPKTGSTSIQATLKKAVSDKIAYSSFAGVVHNAALLTMFSKKLHTHRTLQYTDPKQLDQLRKDNWAAFYADMQGKKNLVISSEVISLQLDAAEQEDLKSILLQYFDEIRCLAYLRPAIPFAASGFQQIVKQGRNTLQPDMILFRERLETWLTIFGREQTELRYYDPASLHKGDVVEDAMNFFGWEMDNRWKLRRNEALSLEALALLYKFNQQMDPSLPYSEAHAQRRSLMTTLKDFGSHKFGFTKAILDKSVEDQRDDIEWAQALTGFDLIGRYPSAVREIGSNEELLQVAEDCMPAIQKEFKVRSLEELCHLRKKNVAATVPTGFKGKAKEWLRQLRRNIG